MERFPLRVLWLWESVAAVGGVLLLLVFLWVFAPYTVVWYAVLFLLGAVYLFFAVFYIPMYYINGRIGILQDSIVVVTGVFIERTRYQIRSQISSAAVLDNPISFLFSLSTLILYAPGSTVVIPLLDRKKAYEISEMLQKSK